MKPATDARRVVILLLAGLFPAASMAVDTQRPEVAGFINDMVEQHAYDRQTLVAAIGAAETKQTILDAISRPAEKTLTWPEYRNIFIKPERIAAGVEFWRENEAEIARISSETGVSPAILTGIIGVETYFGRITGNYRVLDALATLAFDYPPRSRFFTRELEQFLLLIREERIDATTPTGSYAGAMGRPQFMPSSFRAYAVDSSDDGRRDIWEDWSDVLGSVANYFVEHGWRKDMEVAVRATPPAHLVGDLPKNPLKAGTSVGALRGQQVAFETTMPADHPAELVAFDLGDDGSEYWVGLHNFFVITRYNRSVMYALAVHQLGEAIAEAYRQ
jgi:membrane-bound lytic murein transglycosylase B